MAVTVARRAGFVVKSACVAVDLHHMDTPVVLDERTRCELCGIGISRASAGAVERDGELLVACVGCQAKVILGEVPGQVVS